MFASHVTILHTLTLRMALANHSPSKSKEHCISLCLFSYCFDFHNNLILFSYVVRSCHNIGLDEVSPGNSTHNVKCGNRTINREC